LRSCCGNFTAFCPGAIPQENAKPRRRAHAGLISAKTNQVFHHAAKIPTHAEIADQDVVFVNLKTSRRGRSARRANELTSVVVLDPDVADVFADSESVNQALRALAGIIQHQSEKVHP
jgi:hypothetical protein